MNIFFYCTFSNHLEWLKFVKKKFKGHKILTINSNYDLKKIDVALVWNLPNPILKKLSNLKLIFSLGAGVDHILKLSDYKQIPIIRIKDPNMRERMLNHVLSQILNYQLKLNVYQKAQKKKLWIDTVQTVLNKDLTIGILGMGYLGLHIATEIKKLNYNVVGFKNSTSKKISSVKIFNGKKINEFIKCSDIIISILPSTKMTENFIDKIFLKKMKKKSLLINIGRGATLNEDDLLSHVKSNNNFYASLDVFKTEPLKKSHMLWSYPNITITPHVAAITDIESSIDYMYNKFLVFKKNNKIIGDVDFKKGY